MTEQAKPEITKSGLLSMQVCVPAEYTDEQAEAFANTENPAGTRSGWVMRHTGDPALAGCAERVPCEQREGCVHIMLDC